MIRLYEILLQTLDISDLKLQLAFFNKSLTDEVDLYSVSTKRQFKVVNGVDVGNSWRINVKRIDTGETFEISIQSLVERFKKGLWIQQEKHKKRKLDI